MENPGEGRGLGPRPAVCCGPCCTGSATSNSTSTGSNCAARGERVPLEPQVFALLALLVDARDRAVTKAEIFEKVWDGRIVTDAALASRVKSARQALGDDGRAQRFIRTIHGRGLRFVANVRIEAAAAAASPAVASPDPPPRRMPPRPSPTPPHGRPSPCCRFAWPATTATTRTRRRWRTRCRTS